MPTFLTTTCLMFSTSEKNQNVQNKTSSFFKHTAFKHLYILDSGIFACIPVTTLRTSRKNAKCVVLASDFIQRLRIKCRCLTKQSFNIKENIVLPICLMVSMRLMVSMLLKSQICGNNSKHLPVNQSSPSSICEKY